MSGSLVSHLLERVQQRPGAELIRRKDDDGQWSAVSAIEFTEQVRALAKGIAASGVQPGDRVALMSRTRYEWTLVDYAIWYAGAVSVPIYVTSSAEQLAWMLSDSGAVAIFLESDAQAELLESVAPQVPHVAHRWRFDTSDLEQLVSIGAIVGTDDLESRRSTATPSSPATIVYTSGTSGRPKACTLTHGNLMFTVDAVVSAAPQVFGESGSVLLFLPLAHILGRSVQLRCIRGGAVLGHCSDIDDATEDVQHFEPTVLPAVPANLAKIFTDAELTAQVQGRGILFSLAAHIAEDYSRSLETGGPGRLLVARHTVMDRLVYRSVRQSVGGNAEYVVSGGAALGESFGHFFRGIGLTVLEEYGLTETSAAATMNLPDDLRIATVGRPIPGTEISIATDGEVLIRGPHVFAGYWNNMAATAQCLDRQGWFRTGDLGSLDDDGHLTITGRKEDIIVTSSGGNVAPTFIEERLRAHPLIAQCMIVGEGRPHIGALITIDRDALETSRARQGLAPDVDIDKLVDDERLLAEIQKAVDEANASTSAEEQIRTFRVLPQEWTESGAELTPLMTVRRHIVADAFSEAIEALYAGGDPALGPQSALSDGP